MPPKIAQVIGREILDSRGNPLDTDKMRHGQKHVMVRQGGSESL